MMRTRLAVAAAVASLVVGAACSGSESSEISLPGDAGRSDDVAGTVTTGDEVGTVTTGDGVEGDGAEGGEDPAESDEDAFVVAQAVDQTLVVREAAQDGADELLTLSAADEVSGKIVCLVSQQIGSWVEVHLPSGEVDRAGWVAREDVTLSRHRFRIEVSVSDHTLTLFTGDHESFTAPVGVGPDAPEPGGDRQLFIKDLVKTPDPDSPYGAYAYGLSGSDNDLDAFTTGNGVVALHGTGDPSGLGRDVRYGSIAVGSDTVTRLVDTIGLPLGTPVDVVE
jgi:lipoprotein-anchoring transpeptidase ErfK/SrfK